MGAAWWGLFGGFAVEALEFWTAVRRHHLWPWENPGGGPTLGPLAYATATALRLVVGTGVAVAARTSGHSATAWVAMIVGAGTPSLLERVTAFIPLAVQASVTALTATTPRLGESAQAAFLVRPPDPSSTENGRPGMTPPDGQSNVSDGEGQGE